MQNDNAQLNSHLSVRLLLGGAALFTLCLLVYASLVPLEYTPLDWETTYDRWQNIPWLVLGIVSRADWVANALVVIPPSFLAAGFLTHGLRSIILRGFLLIFSAAFYVAVVLGIEMLQVWFPPRTVSQNDIIAGWIGAVIGAFSWPWIGEPLLRVSERYLRTSRTRDRLRLVCLLAMLFCILYTIFPLDLVLTAEEWQQKMALDRLTIIPSLASLSTVGFWKGAILSTARVIPFGLWLGLRSKQRHTLAWLMLFAVFLEVLQIPIFSKHASLTDVLVGFMGGVFGWVLVSVYPWWEKWIRIPWLWTVAFLLGTMCVSVAFLARFERVATSSDEIANRWKDIWTIPLLRYYYTSEYSALTNLGGKLILFFVLGAVLAGTGWSNHGRSSGLRFMFGLIVVVLAGIGIEVAQVYLILLVADATDVAIYAIGYTSGYLAMRWLQLPESKASSTARATHV